MLSNNHILFKKKINCHCHCFHPIKNNMLLHWREGKKNDIKIYLSQANVKSFKNQFVKIRRYYFRLYFLSHLPNVVATWCCFLLVIYIRIRNFSLSKCVYKFSVRRRFSIFSLLHGRLGLVYYLKTKRVRYFPNLYKNGILLRWCIAETTQNSKLPYIIY